VRVESAALPCFLNGDIDFPHVFFFSLLSGNQNFNPELLNVLVKLVNNKLFEV